MSMTSFDHDEFASALASLGAVGEIRAEPLRLIGVRATSARITT